MRRILLMGYFGAGNFGDEALLCDWLKRRRGWMESENLKADVISNGGDLLGGFAEGDGHKQLVHAEIPKKRALKVNPREYAALIAPGGSLLQDATSVRSLLLYLLLLRRFHARGVRTFMLNQGIGPLNSWLAGFYTPRQLAGCTMLSLRDTESHDYCLRNGFLSTHRGLAYSADPIIAAQFEPVEPAAAPVTDGPYALVIPRRTGDLPTPVDPLEESAALAVLLEHCAEVTGLETVLLPVHPAHDGEFCRSVAAVLQGKPEVIEYAPGTPHPFSRIWQAIAGASLVISYRLHGLVAAAAHSVPAIGVAYDPKVSSLCNELGLPYCFPATVHETDSLDDLRRLWNSRASVVEYMNSQREGMIRRLDASEEKFDELW